MMTVGTALVSTGSGSREGYGDFWAGELSIGTLYQKESYGGCAEPALLIVPKSMRVSKEGASRG